LYTQSSDDDFDADADEQEVLEAIAETAFKASDLPLILSFENHCSYVPVFSHQIALSHKLLTHVQNHGFHMVLLSSPYVIGQTIIFLPVISIFYVIGGPLYFCPVVSFYLLSFYLSFFYSSPNLSGHRLDVYHTSTHGVALVRI